MTRTTAQSHKAESRAGTKTAAAGLRVAEGAGAAARQGPTEAELIARAKAGDAEAFGHLVRSHQDRVFSLCLRMLGDREAALDCAQDSFVRAYRAIGRFRESARFYTWMYTIAANTCRNRLREQARRRKVMGPSLDAPIGADGEPGPTLADAVASADPRPDEQARRSEIREKVQAALLRLSPQLRKMIVLRDVEGLSYEEIGSTLRIRPGTVKSRIHRARLALRDELGEVMDL